MNTTTHRVSEIQEATEVAIDRLVSHGEAYAQFSLRNFEFIDPMKREVMNRTPSFKRLGMMRNHGVEDGWRGVSRASFFGYSHLRAATTGQRLGALLFPSRLWLPNTHRSAQATAEALRASSQTGANPVTSLRNWQPNRIGINVMDGSPAEKAMIKDHVDVETELGAVVVFELFREGISGSNYLYENNLSIIFSKDTCDEVGIPQPVHSAESDRLRYSVTFAELNPGEAVI